MFVSKMKYVAMLLALIPCLPTALMGQQAASVHGVVADPTGAVIPGAIVTLTSAKAEKFTATSGGDGTYQIRSVPQGVYQLTVSAGGFAAFLRAGVIVTAGAAKTLDVKLEIEIQQQNVRTTAQLWIPAPAATPAHW
jgi:Carboxypeptidase regulatory-like domain